MFWDLNRGPLEYKSEALSLQPTFWATLSMLYIMHNRLKGLLT